MGVCVCVCVCPNSPFGCVTGGQNEKTFIQILKINSPMSQYERPRVVALASSACVDKTTKIITEFTPKDLFLHLK